jgi:hypothetical protein
MQMLGVNLGSRGTTWSWEKGRREKEEEEKRRKRRRRRKRKRSNFFTRKVINQDGKMKLLCVLIKGFEQEHGRTFNPSSFYACG